MAGASTTFEDQWSVFHNQAGLAEVDGLAAGLFVEREYGIKELNAGAFTCIYGMKELGSIGLSFHQFNFGSLYSQQKFALALAKNLGKKVSAGIQLNAVRLDIDEYGNTTKLVPEAGLLFDLTHDLKLGVHVYNPAAQKFSDYQNEKIPTIFSIGTGYNFSQQLLWTIEAEKSTSEKISFKSGLEYKVDNKFFLRAGAASNPVIFAFGLGFNLKHLQVNIAFDVHQVLGVTPYVDLNYLQNNPNNSDQN